MTLLKKTVAMTMVAAVAVSSLCIGTVLAEETEKTSDSTAGIDFTEGDTVITPSPNPNLSEIKSSDIFFGEQKISAATEIYNSTKHDEDEDLKYAGFIVSAVDEEGWRVNVKISGFEMGGQGTMENFELNLTPDGIAQTTDDNTVGKRPAVKPVKLTGGADQSEYGDEALIFEAKKYEGYGMWGCNWEGDLTVPFDSVKETGEAAALMMWTLLPGNVQE